MLLLTVHVENVMESVGYPVTTHVMTANKSGATKCGSLKGLNEFNIDVANLLQKTENRRAIAQRFFVSDQSVKVVSRAGFEPATH